MTANRTRQIKVTTRVSNVDLQMEVDAGASVSIISESTYRQWRRKQIIVRGAE